MSIVLEGLSADDLLGFATASSACRSTVRPLSLELDIYSSKNLQVMKGLQRWGCLEQLQQVTVRMGYDTANGFVSPDNDDGVCTSSDFTQANLQVLGTCSSLERVIFKSSYIDRRVLSVLDIDLLFVERFVATASGPAGRRLPFVEQFPVVQTWQDKFTWYQIFRWPPGVPVLRSDMLFCEIAIYESGHRAGFDLSWLMMNAFQLRRRGSRFNNSHRKRYGGASYDS